MCRRYRCKDDLAELEWEFSDLRVTPLFIERYNIAPTQVAPVIRLLDDGISLDLLPWGFRSPNRVDPIVNARAETAATKTLFAKAFAEQRCLVVAHGFYEWEDAPEGARPWHFHLRGDGMMLFAGLYQMQPTGLPTFAIITTASNPLVGSLHKRMPAILDRGDWRSWLNPSSSSETLRALLRPYPEELMEAWPVTPAMDSPRFESPECMTPLDTCEAFHGRLHAFAEEERSQMNLFQGLFIQSD